MPEDRPGSLDSQQVKLTGVDSEKVKSILPFVANPRRILKEGRHLS